ncbi:MAG: hypothetical protein ACK5RO_11565 [Pseudobdellovibrionaceae bacterium]
MKLIWIFLFLVSAALAGEPDWSQSVQIPDGGRSNPYLMDQEQYQNFVNRGEILSPIYPVTLTGLQPGTMRESF